MANCDVWRNYVLGVGFSCDRICEELCDAEVDLPKNNAKESSKESPVDKKFCKNL